jgi:hypothetical protein
MFPCNQKCESFKVVQFEAQKGKWNRHLSHGLLLAFPLKIVICHYTLSSACTSYPYANSNSISLSTATIFSVLFKIGIQGTRHFKILLSEQFPSICVGNRWRNSFNNLTNLCFRCPVTTKWRCEICTLPTSVYNLKLSWKSIAICGWFHLKLHSGFTKMHSGFFQTPQNLNNEGNNTININMPRIIKNVPNVI